MKGSLLRLFRSFFVFWAIWQCYDACVSHAVAREVPVTILTTTDLHGHLLPCTDYEGNANVGGLLRCASLIQDLRSRYPNVLYVDCGDLIQGGGESWLSRGRIMVRALEWLGCDAWVVGNHDFDWGVDTLLKLHDSTDVPMLGANIRWRAGSPPLLPNLRSHVVKNMDGVRVALLGLTSPAVSTWLTPDILGDVLFEDSLTALRRVMPEVKEDKPDIIVLLVHQGLAEFQDDHANEIAGIAARFPEIDVIIGAHTHKVREGHWVNGILYVQAGYHGNWLGQVDMVYDTVRRKLVKRESRVHHVGREWDECGGLRDHLGEELQRAEGYLSKVLSQCDEKITSSRKPPCNSPMQVLIASAMAEKAGADIVLQGVFSEEELEKGPVTMADIWRVVPYENTIGVLSLTASELRDILEENALLAGSHHFLGTWGLAYDLDTRAPEGSRVSNLRLPDGAPLHGRKRFRVAVGSFALASGGRRYPVLSSLARKPECRLEMTNIDTRTAVIDYVRKRRRLKAVVDTGTVITAGSD